MKMWIGGAVLLAVGLPGFGEDAGEWRMGSETDRAIEYRVSRPANNSCEVVVRDLRMRQTTRATVTTHYLAHKNARKSVTELTTVLELSGSGSDRQHVFGCEAVVSVSVTGIVRK